MWTPNFTCGDPLINEVMSTHYFEKNFPFQARKLESVDWYELQVLNAFYGFKEEKRLFEKQVENNKRWLPR